uniref:Uncharacterized protein n=1 Tax=Ixodes ricinus TaxID=34613 RepID=A0A6B0V4V1_IXORI
MSTTSSALPASSATASWCPATGTTWSTGACSVSRTASRCSRARQPLCARAKCAPPSRSDGLSATPPPAATAHRHAFRLCPFPLQLPLPPTPPAPRPTVPCGNCACANIRREPRRSPLTIDDSTGRPAIGAAFLRRLLTTNRDGLVVIAATRSVRRPSLHKIRRRLGLETTQGRTGQRFLAVSFDRGKLIGTLIEGKRNSESIEDLDLSCSDSFARECPYLGLSARVGHVAVI